MLVFCFQAWGAFCYVVIYFLHLFYTYFTHITDLLHIFYTQFIHIVQILGNMLKLGRPVWSYVEAWAARFVMF